MTSTLIAIILLSNETFGISQEYPDITFGVVWLKIKHVGIEPWLPTTSNTPVWESKDVVLL